MLKNALFAASLVLGCAANAAIVYDNGAPDTTSGNDATAWVQAEDFVLGSNTTLTGAGVYLAGFGGFGDWDGNLRWYIFDDAGGTPGNVLASNLVSPTAVDTGSPWCCGGNSYLLEFSLNFAATAGTTYWLGIHASADGDYLRDDIYWVTTAANASAWGRESEGGTFNNWFENGSEHAFYLTADQAVVPEAATWVMLIAGFGLAGVAMRRRRAEPATA